MALSRIVLTPWDGQNEDLLERCKESVKESGIEHVVIRCDKDWQVRIFELRDCADMVATVDADDIVYPNALKSSFDLLESSGVALVHTDEVRIDMNDRVVSCTACGDQTPFDIASSPTAVHHLVVTRKGAMTDRPLKAYSTVGVLLDWAMRVEAASKSGKFHGIMRNPMFGYGWRLRGNQITESRQFHDNITENIQLYRRLFREWITGANQPL
jgi:hypothetical protein